MITATGPDIMVVERNNSETRVISMAVSGDFKVIQDRKQEKNIEISGLCDKQNVKKQEQVW